MRGDSGQICKNCTVQKKLSHSKKKEDVFTQLNLQKQLKKPWVRSSLLNFSAREDGSFLLEINCKEIHFSKLTFCGKMISAHITGKAAKPKWVVCDLRKWKGIFKCVRMLSWSSYVPSSETSTNCHSSDILDLYYGNTSNTYKAVCRTDWQIWL